MSKIRISICLIVFFFFQFKFGFAGDVGGIDQAIDSAFAPIAQAWERIVFFKLPRTNVPFIIILLSSTALFFTLYFRFPNFTRFKTSIDVVRGKFDHVDLFEESVSNKTINTQQVDIIDTIKDESKHGEVNHFQALATALSGTVGLGNIAGVAIAISIGGPGATFWMIICGLLGMTTKFVECTLGVKYRDIGHDGTIYGGPMYYLKKGLTEKGFPTLGKVLAVVFAIFCIGGSFGGGNAAQANQATASLIDLFNIQWANAGTIIGFVMAILVGFVIIGGIKRIASVTEKLVPLMALIYLGGCFIVLFTNITYLDDAIMLIFREAFSPTAAVGGFFGVLIQGFRRAVFSNEAGAGSATIAHSAVKTKYAASEGLVALLEPFIDTVVICTMTALVIIFYNHGNAFAYGVSPVVIEGTNFEGVGLTSMAFAASISWFPVILTISIVLFAISTMISWSYYGLQAWKYLFGRSPLSDISFKIIFCSFIVIGSAANMTSVWGFSDAMILAMVFPNMIGLLILFPQVKTELDLYINAIKRDRTN